MVGHLRKGLTSGKDEEPLEDGAEVLGQTIHEGDWL
jgi:hypothetical protein